MERIDFQVARDNQAWDLKYDGILSLARKVPEDEVSSPVECSLQDRVSLKENRLKAHCFQPVSCWLALTVTPG